MKSPLVDALRQARGQSSDAEERQETAEAGPEIPDSIKGKPTLFDMVPPQADDLTLLDESEAPAAGEPDPEFEEVALTETAVDIILDQPPEADAPLVPEQLVVPPVTHRVSQPGLPRLGLYSPIICLVLAAAAIGGYFIYREIGIGPEGSGLAALSSRGSSAVAHAEFPVGPSNHFKLITDGGTTQSSADGLDGTPVDGPEIAALANEAAGSRAP